MQDLNSTVPCAPDAEVALLGCIFIDENLIYEVADILQPDDFYDHKNKLIYKTMVELSKTGTNIDVTTVAATLLKNNLLEQCGGMEYFKEIAAYEYSTANSDSYISLIESQALKRKTIYTLNNLAQKGYKADLQAFDYVEEVERAIFDLSKRRRVDSFKPMSVVAKKVLENTEHNATKSTDIIGLNTGFDDLNKLTQGFQPGQLIILAARPAMGKSAFAMNLAIKIAEKNNGGLANVAIFSLEMSAEQLAERMVASESSVSLKNIKSGRIYDKRDWMRFTTACSKLGNLNIYFDDASDSTIASIRAKCRKQKSEGGLDFVIIDYLQLIASDNQADNNNQVARITKISRNLKLMARELEVPVVALSQLSRKVEERDEKIPMMSDLRDSGSIEQDADMVMFLYREDYYKKDSPRKNEADLILAKNRSGNIGTCTMIFQGEIQRFNKMEEEKEE